MTDLSTTIAPKSDQLNADDLINGPITITITKVSPCKEPEQPIAIYFEGDNNKPYKPGKSMRRVLVNFWGADGNTFAGRQLTLYRDDEVVFGGLKVGGIRISHMTNIDGRKTMALTASRASRKPFTVNPLVVKQSPSIDPALQADAEAAAAQGLAFYQTFWTALSKEQRAALLPGHDGRKQIAQDADNAHEKPKDAEIENV